MKTKTHLLTLLILSTLPLNCFSQGYSSAANPVGERKNVAANFEKTKGGNDQLSCA